MNLREIPPTAELFSLRDFVPRHPTILSESRVRWVARNRETNGAADAFFDSRSGELLIHEPSFLRWFLGLSGRNKPRTGKRVRA